jgi:hypothetical protein
VLFHALGLHQRVAQEVDRRDVEQFGADLHRPGRNADRAHVRETRQTADGGLLRGVSLRLLGVLLGAEEGRVRDDAYLYV